MGCILRIIGFKFDVDAFLEATSLKVDDVWHIGAPKMYGSEEVYTSTGCTIIVSNADFDQLTLQKKEAIIFLEKHFNDLMHLQQFGLVENEEEGAVLDFGITTRMFDSYTQTDYFEPRLLQLAGNLNINIALSQYPPSEEEEEDQPRQR